MSPLDIEALRASLALPGAPHPGSAAGIATLARHDILLAPGSAAAIAAQPVFDAHLPLMRHHLEVTREADLLRLLLRENRPTDRTRRRHAQARAGHRRALAGFLAAAARYRAVRNAIAAGKRAA